MIVTIQRMGSNNISVSKMRAFCKNWNLGQVYLSWPTVALGIL